MEYNRQGSEVRLVAGGRVVTRFRIDLPPTMLVEEINNGRRVFKKFGQGEKLAAEQRGTRVIVCAASEVADLDPLIGVPTRRSILRECPPKTNGLTLRQRQVLSGLASGQTLAGIGYRLGIRTRSVRHHVDALKRRFGAVSLSELVTRALAAGLDLRTPPQGGTGAGQRSDP